MHISYDYKVEVYALRNKSEPHKFNAVKILELSNTMIAKIAAGQNSGLKAVGEKYSPGNFMIGKNCGSILRCCSMVSGPRNIGKVSSVYKQPERADVRF